MSDPDCRSSEPPSDDERRQSPGGGGVIPSQPPPSAADAILTSAAAFFVGRQNIRPNQRWPVTRLMKLAALWFGGVSVAAIGRAMGISKNAVVGKAHRLELPSRESPIIRHEPRIAPLPPARALCRAAVTLPPLPSEAPPPVVVVAPPPPVVAPPPPPQPAPLVESKPAEPETVVVPFIRPRRQCCWLDGHRPNLRQCDDTAQPGKPYCAEHHRRAYIKGSAANAGR